MCWFICKRSKIVFSVHVSLDRLLIWLDCADSQVDLNLRCVPQAVKHFYYYMISYTSLYNTHVHVPPICKLGTVSGSLNFAKPRLCEVLHLGILTVQRSIMILWPRGYKTFFMLS